MGKNNGTASLEIFAVYQKVTYTIIIRISIPLLGINPRELKTSVCTKTWPRMFVVALSKIGKTWKQPKYPSTQELINKMWYMHTVEYYSAIKRI